MLSSNKGADLFQTIRQKLSLYLFIGPGSDLVDHAPGEGHLSLQICIVGGSDLTVIQPCLGDFHNSHLELFTVVGAIIHAHQRNGLATGTSAVDAQSGQLGHKGFAAFRAVFHVGYHYRSQFMGSISQGVTLFGNGKGNHLQAGLGKHVSNTLGVMLHGQTHCQ